MQDAAKLFHETFMMIVPDIIPMDKHPTQPAVQEALNPAAYAIKSDKTSFAVEPAVTRTVRLCYTGTREIYVGDAWAISEFMASESKVFPTLQAVGKFMKSLNAETIEKFLKFPGGSGEMRLHGSLDV